MRHPILAGLAVVLVVFGPMVAVSVVISRSRLQRAMARVPLRSTKADAKRRAHRYAERVTGRPLSWKKARKLMNGLEREHYAKRKGAA